MFNGFAVTVGCGLNYALEGNDHPQTLLAGVGAILVAIMLTFVSKFESCSGTKDTMTTPEAIGGLGHLRRRQVKLNYCEATSPLTHPHLRTITPQATPTPQATSLLIHNCER